eukprot:1029910-Pleurochrysis_carterae.AAC.3
MASTAGRASCTRASRSAWASSGGGAKAGRLLVVTQDVRACGSLRGDSSILDATHIQLQVKVSR